MTIKLAWQPTKGLNGTAPTDGQSVDINNDGTFLVGSEAVISPTLTRNAFVLALDWTIYDTTLNSNCTLPAITGSGVAYPWGINDNINAVPMTVASGTMTSGPQDINASQDLLLPQADGFIDEEGSQALLPLTTGSGVVITDDILNSSATLPQMAVNNLIVFNVNFLLSTLNLPLETATGGIGPLAINIVPMITGSGVMLEGSVTDPFQNPVMVPMIIANGIFLYGYSSVQSLPEPTGSGVMFTGQVFGSDQTLPMETWNELLYEETKADSTFTLPQWLAFGTITESVGGLNFEVVSMHTERQALVEYTNYPFNSFTTFNGKFIAASDNGLFELTGDTDDGEAINSVVRTGTTDFGSQHLKRVPQMYVSYITDGQLLLSTITDRVNINEYKLYQTPETDLHPVRAIFGRGVMARHWQFEIRNVAGCNFSLNEMQCDPIDVQRKVGGVHA